MSHDEAEKDYKEASFKIQKIRAKQLNLEEGETLSKEDTDELELNRTYCMECAEEMKTCANKYKTSYMKFMGERGLRASFKAIIKKELDTVCHHRIKK